MGNLIQIIYISRATTGPANPGQEVDPVVSRILAKSRANNRKHGLTGVLYFGNGCFFQCLEGETAAIDALYAKLEQDDRHRDLKLVSRKAVARPSFEEWSMKYVPVDKEIAAFLGRHGMPAFDPYQFDAAMTQEVIGMLQGAPEPEAAPAAAAPPVPQFAPVTLPRRGWNKGMLALAGLFVLAVGFALEKLAG
jgi:hypothetical protein